MQGIWAVHDGSRAVNPREVEGRIEGGIVQALGQGLMEDYRLADGHTSTPGFAKYILPAALDGPQVKSVILEYPDPIGPPGSKGIGAPALVPTIPAIINTIHDAVGARITARPALSERVREALRDKERPMLGNAAEGNYGSKSTIKINKKVTNPARKGRIGNCRAKGR